MIEKQIHICRPARTLHEAIRLVLEKCEKHSASTKHICDEIIRRKLYKQIEGSNPFPDQIYLRARNHSDWFELVGRDIVVLRERNRQRITA